MLKRSPLVIILIVLLSACVNRTTGEPTWTPRPLTSTATHSSLQTTLEAYSTMPTAPVDTLSPMPASTEIPLLTSTATRTNEQTGIPELKIADAPEFGVHINNLGSTDQVSVVTQAGGYWTRFDDFNWDEIEPINTEPENFNWETIDEEALQNAAESGLQVIGIILFTPEWARKHAGSACGPIAENNLEDFAEFTRVLVERYSQPPFNVKYWEIGNEPDIDWRLVESRSGFGCWGEREEPFYGGKYYATMLKTIYPAIKSADPNAHVLIGGLLLDCDPINPPESSPGSGEIKDCSPARFLEGILRTGGGEYFDGVSFHAYDYYSKESGGYGNANWHSSWNETGPVLISKTRFIRDLLALFGYHDKILLNSEVALLCGQDGKEAHCLSADYNETKAHYVAQANAAAKAQDLAANIWYSLTGWRASGLVKPDLQPLPAYVAYQAGAERLQGAGFIKEIKEFDGVMGYEFQTEEKHIWVLWSLDSDRRIITTDPPPTAVYDVFAETLSSNDELVITTAPVYLEWTR